MVRFFPAVSVQGDFILPEGYELNSGDEAILGAYCLVAGSADRAKTISSLEELHSSVNLFCDAWLLGIAALEENKTQAYHALRCRQYAWFLEVYIHNFTRDGIRPQLLVDILEQFCGQYPEILGSPSDYKQFGTLQFLIPLLHHHNKIASEEKKIEICFIKISEPESVPSVQSSAVFSV